MKQPNLKDLKLDETGTEKIRAALAKARNIKITINIDTKSLFALKAIARDTGIPYQRLFHALLKESLTKRESTESRLDRLEQELKKMKRQFAA